MVPHRLSVNSRRTKGRVRGPLHKRFVSLEGNKWTGTLLVGSVTLVPDKGRTETWSVPTSEISERGFV